MFWNLSWGQQSCYGETVFHQKAFSIYIFMLFVVLVLLLFFMPFQRLQVVYM